MYSSRPRRRYLSLTVTVMFLVAFAACGLDGDSSSANKAHGGATSPGRKLKAVATTTIVGDVVRAVGGDAVELTVLIPLGADPHGFEPTPRDVATVADADVIFVNGVGLEVFLEPLLENAGDDVEAVILSDGITLRSLEAGSKDEDEHQRGGFDPHVWFDPNNIMVWVERTAEVLSRIDPASAQTYATHAQVYNIKLQELDAWIQDQVGQIAEADRKIVTDHNIFGYFADRYGFQIVGAVTPGYSTLSEPSAQELADLETDLRDLDVKAIFVGKSVNPSLAVRIAEDTGVRLVFLYTGSLSGSDGPADSYLDFMRFNVTQIVGALE